MMKTINLKRLAISFIAVAAAAILSTLLTPNAGETYAALQKPPLSPPEALFPIVWTILYLLLAVASYLVMDSGAAGAKNALKWFYAGLILNFLWAPVFFGLQQYWLAMVVLIALWAVSFVAAFQFQLINRTAGMIMTLYLVWLSYAAYLNMGIACLN